MNYGIIQNRRPEARQRGATQVSALLADPRMREMARQMGLQPADFGAEAQAVWQTLNELSSSDPKRYDEFINDQLRDGPPLPPASNQDALDDAASASAPKADAPRFFTPAPGFVVKCAMLHSVKCQQRETKLFLNCCAHELVDAPTNPNNGRRVPADTHAVPSTSNLQIPLVVGKLREISDCRGALSCALDVVVHPWVLRRCDWDAAFKREVMKLAVHWVQQDAGVRLVEPVGRLIKARYKGGVTIAGEIITAKFRIDDATAGAKKQRMESPADLLKQMSREEDKEPELTLATSVVPEKSSTSSNVLLEPQMNDKLQPPPAPISAMNVESKPNKVLIEELPSPSRGQAASTLTGKETMTVDAIVKPLETPHGAKKKAKRSAGVVKRGFLNSSKTQLYPKGSSEGHAPSAYVNLLSRSKVVDLGEAERQHQAQEEQRTQSVASLLETMEHDDSKTKKPSSQQDADVDHGDYAFEQLCLQADPDLQPASSRRDGAVGAGGDAALGLDGNFEALTKLLAP